MASFQYRLIDTAGSELEIVTDDRHAIGEDDAVSYDGREFEVIEVYDDEHGRDGGVVATLVIDA
jgi:hypothetical protein